MLTKTVTIVNKLGLHARAAALFANTAARFSSHIKAGVKSNKMVDAKSVMSLMLLAASQGSQLQLEVSGDDQEAALQAIEDLISNRFGEAD
jgi:phosphocarrier protein